MRIIVVGGGIAGPATAIGLRQQGHEVTVYEAYEDPAGDVGGYLSFAINGMRALERLGLLREVQTVGYEIERMRFHTGRGALLGDVPRLRRSSDTMRSVTLMRAPLVAMLRRTALDAGVRIVTRERLVDIQEDTDRVTAGFASGHRDTADLIVGADGVHSTVRGLIDPSAPRSEYAGLYGVMGISSIELEPRMWNLTFGKNGVFVHTTVDERTAWWAAQLADPVEPKLPEFDEGEWLRRLEPLFPERMPAAVMAQATKVLVATRLYTCDPVKTWRTDRVVMLGDAVHPAGVGQGASMAIEDAVVLTNALRDQPSLPAALKYFEEERRRRTERVMKHADDARNAKLPGPVKRFADMAMMKMFLPFMERANGYLYDYKL